MKTPNPYDYLKVDCLDDVKPIEATSSWTITDSRKESITITNALLPDGFWVYGYHVYWAKGDTSFKKPTAEFGKFHTHREAKLHALGFFKIYLDYFLPETRKAILDAENSIIQPPLFE